MSWSIEHWNKDEDLVGRVSLAEAEVAHAHAILDEHLGFYLGEGLSLPERLDYVLYKLLKEIKQLHEEVRHNE